MAQRPRDGTRWAGRTQKQRTEPNLGAAGLSKEMDFFFFEAVPKGLAQTPLVELG